MTSLFLVKLLTLKYTCGMIQDLGAIVNPMFKLKGPTMLQGSYNPAFPLKHQQKDMRLALALGDENAVAMPVSAAANEVYLCPNLLVFYRVVKHWMRYFIHMAQQYQLQAFKKARSLGLGDMDFSAVHEVVKGAGGSGQA
jgi:glyoxylate/succinic semialdehyde reductase